MVWDGSKLVGQNLSTRAGKFAFYIELRPREIGEKIALDFV
jgi:hypothetical protein